ncbi:MAG: hypothetical protein SOY48_04185 [Eubacterium sp.]|nr:hypothetical protein [Eubacterium sp.]MDY4110074.1 hypothetical protein [Eubacterium sp.]
MKKLYEEPEIQIRNYALPARDVVMTSDPNVDTGTKGPDLTDGDDYDFFK